MSGEKEIAQLETRRELQPLSMQERLKQVEATLCDTLNWLHSLHPMPSRSQRIDKLEHALALVRVMRSLVEAP